MMTNSASIQQALPSSKTSSRVFTTARNTSCPGGKCPQWQTLSTWLTTSRTNALKPVRSRVPTQVGPAHASFPEHCFFVAFRATADTSAPSFLILQHSHASVKPVTSHGLCTSPFFTTSAALLVSQPLQGCTRVVTPSETLASTTVGISIAVRRLRPRWGSFRRAFKSTASTRPFTWTLTPCWTRGSKSSSQIPERL